MPWSYQICIFKRFSSHRDDLPENLVKIVPQDCKKATSGWRASLKNVIAQAPLYASHKVISSWKNSLRKQLTFGDATTGFPAKWCLGNNRRNSILITCHYQDLGSAYDWLNQISHEAWPIRSTTQIWQHAKKVVPDSLRGRRSKGKGKGIRVRDHARKRREGGNACKEAIVFALPPTN